MDKLTREYCDHVYTNWKACRTRSERTQVIMQAVAHTGASKGTIYRNCIEGRSDRKKRSLSARDKERIESCRSVAESVFRFAQLHTHDNSTCSIMRAFKHLQKNGQIAADLTYDRIARAINDLNLHNEKRPRRKRFQMENPFDMVQADFTVSLHLKYRDGEELQVVKASTTKTNKDDRKKLQCAVMLDDCTGVVYAEYFIAKGEDIASVHSFLLNAFSRKPERTDFPNDYLYQGMPKAIYVDNGSAWMTPITERGLAKLGVTRIGGGFEKDFHGRKTNKRNKTGRGKVEAFMDTLKSVFEQDLSLDLGYGYKLSLTELNQRLHEWLMLYNQEHHRDTRSESKWNIFQPALANAHYPPDDALAYFTRQIMRKVARGEINVGKGIICHAPLDVDDDTMVEIFEMQGRHYLYRELRSEPLEYQLIPLDYVPGTKRSAPQVMVKIETDETLLSEQHEINLRLDQELKKLTNDRVSIHSYEIEVMWDSLRPWRSQPQTIAQIKAKASEIITSLTMPSNVIIYPQQSKH